LTAYNVIVLITPVIALRTGELSYTAKTLYTCHFA
jgi:hypothetical protein